MVEVGIGKVLVALNLPNEYEDGCYLFDLDSRSFRREKWFQPEWVMDRWKLQMGPDKGIRDLSAGSIGTKTVAALAAKEGYGSCWEIGTKDGFCIDTKHGVRSVAVHPQAHLVAVGTGKQVLDTATEAIAEVQLWSTGEREMIESRRLPGTCVVKMLWVHSPSGLRFGYNMQIVEGSSVGMNRACALMEPGLLETLLVVTTESRNQRGGFVTLLDPQLLTILDIVEVTEQSALYFLAAWPDSGLFWCAGTRGFDDLISTSRPPTSILTAPLRTSASAHGGKWLSDGRKFRFRREESGAWVAQIWRSSK